MAKRAQQAGTAVIAEIPVQSLKRKGHVKITAGDAEILVVDTSDGVQVYNGVCPHLAGPLLEGKVSRNRIRCPWHDYEFDAKTGKCLTVPGQIWAEAAGIEFDDQTFRIQLGRYPFEISDGIIRVFQKR